MKKIVLIEDDADLFSLIQYNLEKEGYIALAAFDGEAGLELVRKEKPDLIIEVSGYTDNHGSDAINKKLSLDRAKAVVTFLTKKGIPTKQLIAKGYGKENPIALNTLENGKPDLDGMQKNRRVEIKIEDSK